ncbi:MAG TPA: SHOCT domain-containing protein [Solirubrobacterales bacterium]|jgi:ABC-type multidrug transport system fused ATPase/permease subunit|nr:SHOCT domain-containing protein [Solirubrobacterales bacterium]
MLVADYSFGEALGTVLAVFIFVAWIMVLFTVLSDLFRDHEMSGWGKAAWVVFLIFIPFLAVLVYLLARGSGMRDRALQEQAEQKKHFDQYIQETAGTSKVDELASLAELHDKGKLSDAEYEQMKAKLLA